MQCNFRSSIKCAVALRKESVDRNLFRLLKKNRPSVALRKESVDRNSTFPLFRLNSQQSLSARRAWIEIILEEQTEQDSTVALRKESVDRNSSLPIE